MRTDEIKAALYAFADKEKVAVLSNFFKTKEGEYGHGDIFWGVKVPQNRIVAKRFADVSFDDVLALIIDEVHEVRVRGFTILVEKYAKNKNNPLLLKDIVSFYINNCHKANNWDLVDLSAPKILGLWLSDKRLSNISDRDILYKFANSTNLWEQRVSIVSTWTMIRNNDYEDTLRIAVMLLSHPHDLIKKAVGWMLREVGKKNRDVLNDFLTEYAPLMSAMTLSYAIEHYDSEQKKYFRSLRTGG